MRLVCVSLGVLGILGGSRAEADVLHGLFAAVDTQQGGTGQRGTGQPGTSRGAAQPAGQPAPPAGPPAAPPASSADLSAWAGEARAVTLPELLQVTLQKSPALQNARIDIAIAEALIQQTWGRRDWTVRADLRGERRPVVTAGQIGSIRLGLANVGVVRALPTGGTIDLHVRSQYQREQIPGLPPPFDDSTTWSQEVTAALTQPLLRGRGRALYDAAEARAALSRDAAVLARRLVAINTVQVVISAYWDLVLAERGVAITQASLDLARERLRVTQIGADGGKIPRSEIPAVLQIIATREEDVLNGELGVLDRSIVLRRAAGMPIGAGELGLRVATDLGAKDQPLDLGQLVERAFAASPELAQLAKQDAGATIEIAVTENGLLPQLDLALSLGPAVSGDTFSDSWKDFFDPDSLALLGTLTFSQSLGRNEVRGRVREVRETRRKLAVNADEVRAQIAQGMTRAVAQVELARRRVQLSQRAIDLANENIKIETDRFNLGKSTNFDVLNRQEDLRQAELRKTQALIDWHKAETVVESLTGDLLPAYGITVE